MNLNIIYTNKLAFCIAVIYTMCSCSDTDDIMSTEERPATNMINLVGIETDEMEVSATRAANVDAENVSWLVQPLKNGLDITYGLYDATPNHQDVAILQLQTDADGNIKYETYTDANGVSKNVAVYTFRYRDTSKTREGVDNENNAIWYNNGFHYFQGVHVPERIRYASNITDVEGNDKAPGLVLDQHDDTAEENAQSSTRLGNYTLLAHYLGMPANYRLTATVERIKLPFRHRLARVVAFVLIDPELNTHLKGYKKNADGTTADSEDPNTTSIRFCNVKVLQGVKDVEGSDGHHTLTPQWTQARKIIPHFDGERGSYSYKTLQELDENFMFYYKESGGKNGELYPTSDGWGTVHNKSDHDGYTAVNYGKVPVYDIIVRPTYTSEENVMYDEDLGEKTKKVFAQATNKIDFELELENGLRYEKEFEFDLDANYQTVVYLRISREHVDYNASGSDLWVETKSYDAWYGVNNKNGNTLSKAGSSWQRAYTFGAEVGENPGTLNGVTDGQFYNASLSHEEREKAQYFTSDYKEHWIEKFLQAYKTETETGAHHGDYFVLKSNITIDATLIPKDFVFTGHLDGQDHTITLTNPGKTLYKEAEDIEQQLYTLSDNNYTEWKIPTLYVPVYYSSDELVDVNGVSYVKETLKWVEEENIYYTTEEVETENAHHRTLATDKNGKFPYDDGYETTWILISDVNNIEPGGEGYITTYEYEDNYTPVTTSTIKKTIPGHYEIIEGAVEATTETVKRYDKASQETTPAYPTTLEQLKTPNTYYISGDEEDGYIVFTCPESLYQFSHVSPAYLFYGLDGIYTTPQETATNPYSADVKWEANVHKETNKKSVWVPTVGYRAEVLNTVIASPYSLFREGANITGNVQNCHIKDSDGKLTAISNNTPAIPQYK